MCLQCVHYSVGVAFVDLVFLSLAVLCVPSLSPQNNFPELSGSSMMGAWGGLGAGGSWLGCGLAGQSGVLVPWGSDCGYIPPGFLGTYSPLATWALIIIYLTGIFSPIYGSCLNTSMILFRSSWMPFIFPSCSENNIHFDTAPVVTHYWDNTVWM